MGRRTASSEYLAEIGRRTPPTRDRDVAPLRIPDGALVLDTGELGVDECVDAIAAALERIGA